MAAEADSHWSEKLQEPATPILRPEHGSSRDTSEEVVDFDGDNDPSDPFNWSRMYKWTLVVLISAISLSVNLAILMSAPATPAILEEFHSDSQLQATILVSVWELGEVVGPLILAPLSELYGRLPVYHSATVLFVALSIAAAKSTSIQMLIAFRFLLGVLVASSTLNSCIVGDMFRHEQRGQALSIMGMVPYVAPCLGPTIGGFVSDSLGWRWTFWMTAIITGSLEVFFLFLFRETYRVTILRKKLRRLRVEMNCPSLRLRYEEDENKMKRFWQSIIRPPKLLFASLSILLVAICGSFAMGYVYVAITSMTLIFEQTYSFSESHVGLSYLGLGCGMIAGIIATGLFLDWYYSRETRRGVAGPESRLPPMVLGYSMVPIGLLCFGWTVQYRVHWIVPILSTVLMGIGFTSVTLSSWSYLIDAYGVYAASATAGAVVLRNAASAALPLAAPPLQDRVGLGVAYTILAAIALLFTPAPYILMRFGRRIRGHKLGKLSQA